LSTIFDYAILNGTCLPVDRLQISIFNKALFSGFGVYEAIKVDQGRPFYLEEHVQRLFQSAAMIDLALNVDGPTLISWVETLREIDPQATWRLTVLALGAVEAGEQPLIAMRPEALATYPPHFYRDGAKAVLYQGQRLIPACKSLNTLASYLARRAAIRVGALEGLLYHHGHLTEGSRSNLFAVRQGQLITPPAIEVLSGITRDIIVQVMQDTGHPVIEAPLPAEPSLYDEIFISCTSMHVMPITQIDGRPVGSGQVGPVTKLAAARFAAHYRQVMATFD
jgi:branched-subunit amino acid aminotransferase/4-amino-4-deoxychorismate lyase